MTERFNLPALSLPNNGDKQQIVFEIKYLLTQIRNAHSDDHLLSPSNSASNFNLDLDSSIEQKPVEVSEEELNSLSLEELTNYKELLTTQLNIMESRRKIIVGLSGSKSLMSARRFEEDEPGVLDLLSPKCRSLNLDLADFNEQQQTKEYQQKLEEQLTKLNEEIVELRSILDIFIKIKSLDIEQNLLMEYLKSRKEQLGNNGEIVDNKNRNENNELLQEELERTKMYCEDLYMRLYLAEEKLKASKTPVQPPIIKIEKPPSGLINARKPTVARPPSPDIQNKILRRDSTDDSHMSKFVQYKQKSERPLAEKDVKCLELYDKYFASSNRSSSRTKRRSETLETKIIITRSRSQTRNANKFDPTSQKELPLTKSLKQQLWSYIDQLQDKIMEMNRRHQEAIKELTMSKDNEIRELISSQKSLKKKVEKVVSLERWKGFSDKTNALKNQNAEISTKEKKLKEFYAALKDQQNKISQKIEELKPVQETLDKSTFKNKSMSNVSENSRRSSANLGLRYSNPTNDESFGSFDEKCLEPFQNIEKKLKGVERLWNEGSSSRIVDEKELNPLSNSLNLKKVDKDSSQNRYPGLTTNENEKESGKMQYLKPELNVSKITTDKERLMKEEARLIEANNLLKIEAKKLSLQSKLFKLEWEKIENKTKELEFLQDLLQIYTVNVVK